MKVLIFVLMFGISALSSAAGFKVKNEETANLFQKIGIKEGDVILSYNGEAVDSPVKAMEMYKVIKMTTEPVSAVVVRNGKQRTLHFNK